MVSQSVYLFPSSVVCARPNRGLRSDEAGRKLIGAVRSAIGVEHAQDRLALLEEDLDVGAVALPIAFLELVLGVAEDGRRVVLIIADEEAEAQRDGPGGSMKWHRWIESEPLALLEEQRSAVEHLGDVWPDCERDIVGRQPLRR